MLSLALASLAAAQASNPGALPDDSIVVRTDRLALASSPSAGALSLVVLDESGEAIYRTIVPELRMDDLPQRELQVRGRDLLRLDNSAVDISLEVLGPRAIAVTWTPRDGGVHEFALSLLSDDETEYYGTGERFNALNQRGYILPVQTDDRFGNKGVGSYKPVPFFMSSRGFGVWVDSYAPGELDLSGAERFRTTLRFPETRFRVVFLGGPDLAGILETFTGLTGRPPVPPPWAFGLWKSRDVHHNQDSVRVDVEWLREYGIPASVLVLDSPWEVGYNDFVVNTEQFPTPEQMWARIRELGFELCLWLTPFVNERNVQDMRGITSRTQTYDEAVRAGVLVSDASGEVALSEWWKGVGGLIDFTDPAAVAWWHAQLAKTREYGARCFKADDGEGNFVPDAEFHDGTPAWLMKNRYAVLYDSVMQAYVDEHLNGTGVLITRTGFTGTQKYPFAWAGDNHADFSFDDGLPSVIIAGQNAALSGFSLWGSDIAGYAGTPTKEVFLRWTQFSTFTPFMQVHMTSNLGPWDFGPEALEIFRRYAILRIQLFPYIYNAVHESARSGIPVIRPMVLAFPDDAVAREQIFQYMFGPDLLVAPMYQTGTHRTVYLPEGRWIDFWSGEELAGGRMIEVEAPLDRIPLWVRAGAILPLLPDDVETLVPRHPEMADDIVALDERRVLQIWPGVSGSVETWDGIEAELTSDGDRARLRISSATPRPLEVHLLSQNVSGLEVEGATVTRDPSHRATLISFSAFRGTQTLRWEQR